jgi:hypothetical protein
LHQIGQREILAAEPSLELVSQPQDIDGSPTQVEKAAGRADSARRHTQNIGEDRRYGGFRFPFRRGIGALFALGDAGDLFFVNRELARLEAF